QPLDGLLGEQPVDVVEPVHGPQHGILAAAPPDALPLQLGIPAVEPVQRRILAGAVAGRAAGVPLGRLAEDEPPALQIRHSNPCSASALSTVPSNAMPLATTSGSTSARRSDRTEPPPSATTIRATVSRSAGGKKEKPCRSAGSATRKSSWDMSPTISS